MTNRNRGLLASSSASGRPHLFPPGGQEVFFCFISLPCFFFFILIFFPFQCHASCPPHSLPFSSLSCWTRLAGQWPWQVLQHICLKYARLQNLNFRTSGQYATLFTSLHSGDREKRNVLIGVPDDALFFEYFLTSPGLLEIQKLKKN